MLTWFMKTILTALTIFLTASNASARRVSEWYDETGGSYYDGGGGDSHYLYLAGTILLSMIVTRMWEKSQDIHNDWLSTFFLSWIPLPIIAVFLALVFF